MNRNLAAVLRISASTLAPIVFSLSAFSALAQTATSTIPLIEGLTITHGIRATEGDYESMSRVGGVTPTGVTLTISGDVPQVSGARAEPVSITRTVRTADLANAHTLKYEFNTADGDIIPGSTAIGMSAAVLADVRARGQTQVTLDGTAGGLMGVLGDLLGSVAKSSGMAGLPDGRVAATGMLKLAESKPVAIPVLVNGKRTTLPAYHLRGHIGSAETAEDAELYVLDDPANALVLRWTIGKDKAEVTRIEFPVKDAPKVMERELAESRRTAIYGIYFDFNSATIKPQSEPVLREIVEVMKREPGWTLKVEGHTDNVGGDAKNQDLSARRAAAVKDALVQRGVPAARLTTGGYGASVPRETNATLAGRARNRRVELTRE